MLGVAGRCRGTSDLSVCGHISATRCIRFLGLWVATDELWNQLLLPTLRRHPEYTAQEGTDGTGSGAMLRHVAMKKGTTVPFVNSDPTPRGPANRGRADCDGSMDEVFCLDGEKSREWDSERERRTLYTVVGVLEWRGYGCRLRAKFT